MAKTEKSTKTAEQLREEIANRPRQSVVRLVEYFNIVSELAPERVEEFFGDDVPAIAEVADKVTNPVTVAREKAEAAQLKLAINALTNTDEKNGYANFGFDAEAFAEKTRVKTPRAKKSAVDKVSEVLDQEMSDEDLEALRQMLAARGL